MDTKEREKLTRQRWSVLVVSCLINLCIGSMYTWSVFSGPMAEYLNSINGTALTASSLALAFTVGNSVGPITMISGGFFNDRMGPRWVIFIGGLMFGGGMLLCGFAASPAMLVVGFGLGCGLAMGLVYGCTVSNSVKFFPDKRGLIGGIATATYGIGSVIIPPIATALIARMGVCGAFRTFGVLFLICICGGSFLVKRCPENFAPVGWEPSAAKQGGPAVVDKNWRDMLSSPIFYVMLFMLMCGAFSGLMVTSQTSSIAQVMGGLNAAAAATAVSVLALFNGAGRVLAGWLSDKLGRVRTLQLAFVIDMIGLAMFAVTKPGSIVTLYIGVAGVGFCFGSLMGVYPGFTGDQFGTKHNSVNYGIMFVGFACAGLLGPMGMSAIYQGTGSYIPAFGVGMALAAAGLVMTLVYSKVKAKG